VTEGVPVLKDRSFWGLIFTQFLGAFNDNLFKQLILLLAVPAGVAAMQNAAGVEKDVQGWANMVFSLPFVIFSGFAGWLSDRFSKQRIIFFSKCAEIAIMAIGMIAFLWYDAWGMAGTWTVLFLMGTQSAFFGPGKYGILPELFSPKDLAKANGLILMTTFLAIIFGTVVAGWLMTSIRDMEPAVIDAPQAFEQPVAPEAIQAEIAVANMFVSMKHPSRLWIGSCICVLIAIVGTWTATWLRKTRPARPDSLLALDDFGLAAPIRSLLAKDMPLLRVLLVSSVFWMVSGLTVPIVNRLGMSQLQADEKATSLLVGGIAMGIMGGSILAAVVFKRLSPRGQVSLGLFGMVATLVVLGVWKQGGDHWLGYWGCFAGLLILGLFAAIYAVPIQVFLQDRPPADLKGRMIGTMNQANFIGILLSGPMYQGFEAFARGMGWPISSVFWMLAVLLSPLAIFYRLGK
jgi:acyl-[acyl-carrier-protein]-phospholipid O-acyltransferase/long-chain-fatty-acid--[acyl-carrier-protein] ligase